MADASISATQREDELGAGALAAATAAAGAAQPATMDKAMKMQGATPTPTARGLQEVVGAPEMAREQTQEE